MKDLEAVLLEISQTACEKYRSIYENGGSESDLRLVDKFVYQEVFEKVAQALAAHLIKKAVFGVLEKKP